MKNITNAYNNELCCSCGICEGICPNNAISLDIDRSGFYKPRVDNEKCTDCGLCIKYCPGINYFQKNSLNEKYYYAHSKNKKIRYESSSGGLTTEVLCYLLKNKIVEYAVIIKNRSDLSEPEIIVTNSQKEIIENSTSKYCPVPLGIIIKKVKKLEGKIAIVGLPCVIEAIKEYASSSNKLNRKIKFYFSLLCNHLPSFNATNYIIENFNVKNVQSIKYRGRGWPGYFQIKTERKIHYLPYRKTVATGFGKYFKTLRCYLCKDQFGSSSDISLGDAYFLNEKENYLGNTFCIVRNDEIEDILKKMRDKNIINLYSEVNKDRMFQVFKSFYDRKEEVPIRLYVLKKLGKKLPNNHPALPNNVSMKKCLNIIYDLIKMHLGKHKFLWRILFLKNKGFKLKENVKEDFEYMVVNDHI